MSSLLRRPVAAFLLAGLALAGCGGQGTAGSANHSSTEAAKSTGQILNDAQQAARGVQTFHVVGAMGRARQNLSVDLHFDGGSGAYGSVTYGGVPFHVVRIGGALYFNAPAVFYTKVGSPTRVARTIAGRWIKAPARDSGLRSFANFTSGAQFFDEILGSAASAHMVKVPGIQVINGVPTVRLTDPKDGSSLYIALQGPALPVRIDGPRHSGSMSIAGYGQPVTLVAPPRAVSFSDIKA